MDSKLAFKPEQDVFELLTRWGEQQPLVIAHGSPNPSVPMGGSDDVM